MYHRFDPALVEQLVSLYRIMFPHDDVSDEAYEHVVQKLDERAAQDQDFARLISEGVESLNRETHHAWRNLPADVRLDTLKRIAQTPFFQRLRLEFLVFFYGNPAIWPRFGYEGLSNEKGGYIHRGFNDIDWIKREEG